MDPLVASLLGQCLYDPDAERIYDIMRGGFLWSDEFPACSTHDEFLLVLDVLAPVIAHRASLTLGEPDPTREDSWNALQTAVPSWPGFRLDRIYGRPERDLRAAKIREDRCLAALDRDDDTSDGDGRVRS
jgi:hypothetical protein